MSLNENTVKYPPGNAPARHRGDANCPSPRFVVPDRPTVSDQKTETGVRDAGDGPRAGGLRADGRGHVQETRAGHDVRGATARPREVGGGGGGSGTGHIRPVVRMRGRVPDQVHVRRETLARVDAVRGARRQRAAARGTMFACLNAL